MTAFEEESNPSPFTRPGFLVAAVLVALILIAAVLVVINNSGKSGNSGAGVSTTSAPPPVATSPTPEPTPAGSRSICGLKGEKVEAARLSKAPEVEQWDYQGTMAYPTSKAVGPGAKNPAGFRYCFQHTPEGALFTTAYALAVGSTPEAARTWLGYFAPPGRFRDALVSPSAVSSTDAAAQVRMDIAGFRLLEYTGETARVDIAVTGASQGVPFTGSYIYNLAWTAGDWRMNTNLSDAFSFAIIPNTAGYVPWGSG